MCIYIVSGTVLELRLFCEMAAIVYGCTLLLSDILGRVDNPKRIIHSFILYVKKCINHLLWVLEICISELVYQELNFHAQACNSLFCDRVHVSIVCVIIHSGG